MTDIMDWLLEGEPWVVYHTLTDLLDKSEANDEVVVAKSAISRHPLIKKIFDRRNADGYWGNAKDIHTWWPKKDTTFWILGMLGDLGLTRDDDRIARACEYVFTTQLCPGGFGWDPPTMAYDCHTAILTESLAKLGYRDERLQRAYDWVTSRQRFDGGFWCKDTGQPGGKREKEPSCAMATMCVLEALALRPEIKESEICKRGTEFLLNCWENRGKIKYSGHDSQVGKGWEKLKYPFTDYRILRYLDVLSQFKNVRNDPRMRAMMAMLVSKRDANGRFTPESIHKVWSDFDFGQKERPSRWITLLALRILKRTGSFGY